MTKKIVIISALFAVCLFGGMQAVRADSEATGSITTGMETGVSGTVTAYPTASPAAGSYTSTQSVTLTAAGSSKICYTIDGTTPACATSTTCTTGTAYSSAISVSSSLTLKSAACYADASTGPVGSAAYTISTGGGGGGYTAPSPSAPTISLAYPSNSSVGIAVAVQPYVTFSEAMDSSSVTASTVKLCPASDASCASPVAASVALSEGNKATITPAASLQNGTAYWIYVSTGVKNTNGISMSSAYGSTTVSRFTTATVGTQTTTEGNQTTGEGTTSGSSTPSGNQPDNKPEAQSAAAKVTAILGHAPSTSAEWALVNFIAYGSGPASIKAGSGERESTIRDFFGIFGKLPATDSQWSDVEKILNGERPVARNLTIEQNALKDFTKVYRRLPDFKNPEDKKAFEYMAYHMRVPQRNLAKEVEAISAFKSIYGRTPSSMNDWAVMRAIAYSGAKR